MVSLLGECHEPERRGTDDVLATPGCLWSTCGQGRRAEDRSEAPFATPGCPWSTCGQGPRAEDRPEAAFATRGCPLSTCGQGHRAEDRSEDPLRHAGMPLKYLWGGSPCRWICRAPATTSTAIKQPDSMAAHPIRTLTGR